MRPRSFPRRAGQHSAVRHRAILLLSGLALAFASPAASAQSAPVTIASQPSSYAAFVREAAKRFGIPEAWIWAVMRAESGGRMRAVSPKGAIGLMQIMPQTWDMLRTRYQLGADPFDPRDNIQAGAAYLREMYDRYGDPVAMLAAYNAGPGRYDTHRATGQLLPAETRAYLASLAPLSVRGATGPVAADPPDWRDAPLFVARSSGGSAASSAGLARALGDHRAAPSPRPSTAASSPDSLFAPRPGAGDAP